MPELLTPVQYANRKGIKPQPIYNYIKKQGAPCHWKDGRPYVVEKELDSWLKDKDKRKSERVKQRREKAKVDRTTNIPHEYIDKLAKFGGQRVQHFCGNCHTTTEFMVDITYTGLVMENHVRAYCLTCKLNVRIANGFTNERMQRILDGKEALVIPGPSDEEEMDRIQQMMMEGLIDQYGQPIEAKDTEDRCDECGTILVEDEDSFEGLVCPKCQSILEADRAREDAALARTEQSVS